MLSTIIYQNIGGSRFSNCSMLEAIHECEAIAEKKLNWSYAESNRIGYHIWAVLIPLAPLIINQSNNSAKWFSRFSLSKTLNLLTL